MRSLTLLSLVVLACGGGTHPLADGAADSSKLDAPAADAAVPGMVSVAVTLQGSAAEGVSVIFQNADSSLVGITNTDDNGVASAPMIAGGFVTVLEPNAGGDQVV